jgi:iron complex transport system permease protein
MGKDNATSNLRKSYTEYIRFKVLILIILALLSVLVALVATSAGSSGLTLRQVVASLTGSGTKQTDTIIFSIRLPRIVTAMVGGLGLAAVGCVMQSILRNPLASDSTLGVSQGAAFGASFAIIVLGAGIQNQTLDGVNITNPYIVSICAFICSMMSTFVVLGLSRIKRITPEAMVLAGVALSSLFAGGTTLLQYFAVDVKLAAVVFWTFGDLGRTSWREVIIMGSLVAVTLTYFLFNRWNYNALQSGETSAKSLGVNTEVLRVVGMIICALTSSVIVSFVGIINFVGLIAPHAMRRIVGSDYRFLLPASAMTGTLILLLSDTAARLVVAPVILPIGAITSFVGAPVFLYLLYKGVPRR